MKQPRVSIQQIGSDYLISCYYNEWKDLLSKNLIGKFIIELSSAIKLSAIKSQFQRPAPQCSDVLCSPAAQQPSSLAAQQSISPAAQQPSSLAAQQSSSPAAQQPSSPAVQQPSSSHIMVQWTNGLPHYGPMAYK